MNKRYASLAIALVGAAWLALFGDKTPASNIAEPVTRAADRQRTMISPPNPTRPEREPTILALLPRETLIGATLDEKPSETLFASHNWSPPPPPPKPAPPPPPTAPALPFTYLGKKTEDGKWEVYLGRGDQTFIVQAESVIDGTYRVQSIRPPQLTLIYLPLNQQQTLTIGGTD